MVRLNHVGTGKLVAIIDGKLRAAEDKDSKTDASKFEHIEEGDDNYFKHQGNDNYIVLNDGVGTHGDNKDNGKFTKVDTGRSCALKIGDVFLAFDGDGNPIKGTDSSDDNCKFQIVPV